MNPDKPLTQQEFIQRLKDDLETHIGPARVHAMIVRGMPVVKTGGKPRFDYEAAKAWMLAGKSKPRTVRRAGDTNPNTLRQIKLKMDECRCEVCGWGASRSTLDSMFNKRITTVEMHHILPVRHGGSDTRSNLIALCPQCHWIADRFHEIREKQALVAQIKKTHAIFAEETPCKP